MIYNFNEKMKQLGIKTKKLPLRGMIKKNKTENYFKIRMGFGSIAS